MENQLQTEDKITVAENGINNDLEQSEPEFEKLKTENEDSCSNKRGQLKTEDKITIAENIIINDLEQSEPEFKKLKTENEDSCSNKRGQLKTEDKITIAENIIINDLEQSEPEFKKLKTENEDNCSNKTDTPLSKNRQKKLIKLQQWEIKRVEKRHKEREKARLKRQYARENGLPLRTGPSRKSLKHCTMKKSSCRTGIAIDLSFENYMIEKDISKAVKQLLHTYTLNRRAENPVQLSFTSLKPGGKMHSTMCKHDGYQHWDVNIHEESYLDVFPREKVVYLTSESDNVLKTIEPDEIYIIGGLVDHNMHKGLCHEKAQEVGIRHARLPLEEYLNIKTRKALTIDHVFEIMLRVTEGKPWTDALLQVLPVRKGATAVELTEEIATEVKIEQQSEMEECKTENIERTVCEDQKNTNV